MKVIIADDEKSSRDIIRNYVTKYCPDLDIISEAADAKEAVKEIKHHQPDLVFLDVEMPFGNAFDVLEQTSDIQYHTIFITAFSDYAIKALNYSAAYYILKPISIDELVSAVNKVKDLAASDNTDILRSILKDNLTKEGIKRIVLPNQQGYEIVNADDILRISGNGNYSDLYLKSGTKKTVSKVLKFFSELEQNNNFIRVHKSHIVNLDYVKAYQKGRGGIIVMTDDSEVEVSVSKKNEVLQSLGI